MGFDEALLESGDERPTLRLYSWIPATLSLGYFQRVRDVPAAAHADAVVRRITGGGAIHHAHELTFSISASQGHTLYRGSVGESYSRVHAVLVRALAAAGVEARERGSSALASDCAHTGMCFHESTAQDLVWGARKGVGSAQRRRAGRILHHGSIKLGVAPLEPGVACVAQSGLELDCEEFAPLVLDAFRAQLGIEFVEGAVTEEERARAAELGAARLDPAFVRRR